MAVGRPVLLLGPRRSHIGDILARHDVGWQVDHGDVDALVRTIRAILDADARELERKGLTAQQVVRDDFSRAVLRERFCDVLEGRNVATLY
jgi:colanic acid biosynthesis glycosyl transferase WcaI